MQEHTLTRVEHDLDHTTSYDNILYNLYSRRETRNENDKVANEKTHRQALYTQHIHIFYELTTDTISH